MSAQNGKVALVASTTPLTGTCPVDASIVDLVGYGPTASCSETAPTPVLSSTTAALRKGDGTVDTDDNSADFDIGAPDPHSTADPAPIVQSTMPASGTIGVAASTDVTVTFSEPVDLAADAITIDCATSGPHPAARAGGPTTFTLDPATDLAAGEQCTIAVAAADVSDQDVIDPPDTMAADFTATFTVADPAVCGTPATGIHDVQGAGAASPIAGQTVTVEGVVVGDYQGPGEFGGFYVQEEAARRRFRPDHVRGPVRLQQPPGRGGRRRSRHGPRARVQRPDGAQPRHGRAGVRERRDGRPERLLAALRQRPRTRRRSRGCW